jgi:FMN-dependent oxidoreductase (nitrilotriacetate monooxygenase family)
MTRQMHLGVFVLGTGNHFAGWRQPGASDDFQSLAVSQEIARTAERGKFDFLFLGDGPVVSRDMHPSYMVRPDPLLLLAAIAATTKHVGLGATASTSYSEPFTVARAFATLDHLSGGRAAWNAVTTANAGAAANFGRQHPAHDKRYEIAEEFVEVVRGLWDCWDDDAIVANRETGQYIDWSKVRTLDHSGAYFSVKGPLNVGRSPQGQPVILQAGGSERGQELAARTADVVFTVVQDFSEAKVSYDAFKARLPRHGRRADDVCILPGIMPVLGRTDAEARDNLNELQRYVDDSSGMGMLSVRLGQDLTGFALDDPVPDLPLPDTSHGFARAMLSKARRERMTLRDLYNLTAAARGHMVLCGSPQTVADTLEHWFVDRAADGFNIMPAYFPGAFDAFVDQVVPLLQERGLYRRDYSGSTLREHLGLARPAVKRED